MRKLYSRTTGTTLGAALLSMLLAFPAAAQQQGQQQQQQRAQQQGQQQMQQRNLQAEPMGWVRIGYDVDQDGQFEAVEQIYAFDLERARRASQQRMQGGQQGMQGGQQGMQQGQQFQPTQFRQQQQRPQASQQRQIRVQGEIQNLDTVKLGGGEGTHVVAKIETQQGRTAKVNLGKRDQIDDLDLEEGDNINVIGRSGTIDGRRMLIAQRVQSGDRNVTIQREPTEPMQRLRGTIQQTRTEQFRGVDQPQVVAKVQLQNGRTALVNLGPEDKVKNLEEGDEIAVLGYLGRVNRIPALIAEQVRADNRTIEVNREQERQRFRQTS